MKTIEGVNSAAEERSDASEMSETLKSILQTLGLFTENIDSTIDQLIDKGYVESRCNFPELVD